MATSTRTRTERLDIRVSPELKRLLQKAAEARRKSASDFVRDSALGAAEETLVESRRIGLDTDEWTRFLAALDAPAQQAPRLHALLASESPFA